MAAGRVPGARLDLVPAEDVLPGPERFLESSWKKPYSDRGVRKILARYTQAAGITTSISPHALRHFLFTWLKTQGIDDALIQPYSGQATRQSLEIYSRLALADAQQRYDDAIGNFPVLTAAGRYVAAADVEVAPLPGGCPRFCLRQ
jgi:site-specific recombinase XerD